MAEHDIELNVDACFAMAFSEAALADDRFRPMRDLFLHQHAEDLLEGFRLARRCPLSGGRNNAYADFVAAEKSAYEYGLDVARCFVAEIEDLKRRLE